MHPFHYGISQLDISLLNLCGIIQDIFCITRLAMRPKKEAANTGLADTADADADLALSVKPLNSCGLSMGGTTMSSQQRTFFEPDFIIIIIIIIVVVVLLLFVFIILFVFLTIVFIHRFI